MTAFRKRLISFLASVPIAVLGGLIGLGGAEFRLPVIAGPLGYAVKRAVPLNLLVSLATLTTALVMRGRQLTLDDLQPYRVAVAALICGAVTAAYFGAARAIHISEAALKRIVSLLLAGIGLLLLAESVWSDRLPAPLPASDVAYAVVGTALGLCIGLTSSLLGVAGGELIIPTLVFVFGVDIKTAGTGSLIIGLPTVVVGLIRYARHGAFSCRGDWTDVLAPMTVGSILGALIGTALVGFVSPAALKAILGVVLLTSARKLARQGPRH